MENTTESQKLLDTTVQYKIDAEKCVQKNQTSLDKNNQTVSLNRTKRIEYLVAICDIVNLEIPH